MRKCNWFPLVFIKCNSVWHVIISCLLTVNVHYLWTDSDLVGLWQVRRLLDQVRFKGETAAKTLLQYLEQTETTRPNPEDKENHLSASMRHFSVVWTGYLFMSLSSVLLSVNCTEMGIVMLPLIIMSSLY